MSLLGGCVTGVSLRPVLQSWVGVTPVTRGASAASCSNTTQASLCTRSHASLTRCKPVMMAFTGLCLLSFVDSRQQGAPGYDGESSGAHPSQDDPEEQVTPSRHPDDCDLLMKHERSSQAAEILPPGTSGLERLLQGRTLRAGQV